MNKNTRLLFAHKVLYDVYFYGAITIPFFVSKGYDVSSALAFASVYMIASMVMEVPTGVIGDRYGHKTSVLLGAFLTGCAFAGLLSVDNLLWDGVWVVIFASGAALTSGSDTAMLRFASNNFERDNRIFDYLKSVMLLLSFGAAGFIVEYISINVAIGLSSALAFLSILPLLFVKTQDKLSSEVKKQMSINKQISDLPLAIKKVNGGLSLIVLAGMVGAITFSAKEIISSFNNVYGIDISLIGIIAALAMLGRIVGTAIEKRLKAGHKSLLYLLVLVMCATSLIEANIVVGVISMLLSTVVAQMLFYRLKYKLSSEAPQLHVASLISGMSLTGKLFSGGIIMLTGLVAGLGFFYVSFLLIAIVLVILGFPLATRIKRS